MYKYKQIDKNDFNYMVKLLIGMWLLLCVSSYANDNQRGIHTDNSFGEIIHIPGPIYDIKQQYGKTNGSNLFHSFKQFNIYPDEHAIFSGDASIQNIFARVTGGETSLLNGKLSVDITHSNLYFLNPSGIIIGKNFQFESTGSFHIGTSHYIRFEDNYIMETFRTNGDTLLTAEPPQAFGFFDQSIADIKLSGNHSSSNNALVNGYEGKSISIIAGNIDISSETVDPTHIDPIPIIVTPMGQLVLVSVAEPGEIQLNSDSISLINISHFGDIHINNKSAISSSGGKMIIRAGNLILDNAYINAGQYFFNDLKPQGISGGHIDIQAHNLTLLNGSAIALETYDHKDSGDMHIQIQNNLTMEGYDDFNQENAISTSTGRLFLFQPVPIEDINIGNAGRIKIEANSIHIKDGGVITSNTYSYGKGGEIHIHASESITLEGQNPNNFFTTGIYSMTTGDFINAGNAGKIKLNAKTIKLIDHAGIFNQTNGWGNANAIILQAESLLMDNHALILSESNAKTQAGDAGMIAIFKSFDQKITPSLSIQCNDHSHISTSSNGVGNAGLIILRAQDIEFDNESSLSSVSMDSILEDSYGLMSIRALNRLSLNQGSYISTGSNGLAHAGGMAIETPLLELKSHSFISSDVTFNQTFGDSGLILIAKDINGIDTVLPSLLNNTLENLPAIELSILNANHTIHIQDNSHISTSNAGMGSAGAIGISSEDMILTNASTISSSTCNDQNEDFGIIEIISDNLTLEHSSIISTETIGTGNAGAIIIGSNHLTLNHDSKITSESHQQYGQGGKAGFILINRIFNPEEDTFYQVYDDSQISLNQNSEISTSSHNLGCAGLIMVYGDQMSLTNDSRILSINTGPGKSDSVGLISLKSNRLSLDQNSTISTESLGLSDAGGIGIESSYITLNHNASISSASLAKGHSGDAGHIIIGQRISGIEDIVIDVSQNSFDSLYNYEPIINTPSQSIQLNNMARIQTSSQGTGHAGGIELETNNLSLINLSSISSESVAVNNGGLAGMLMINVHHHFNLLQSKITTESINSAIPDMATPEMIIRDKLNGRISIQYPQYVYLLDSIVSSSVYGGLGNGGNIDFDAQTMLMNQGQIIANAYQGNGGNIHIVSNHFIESTDSLISASSLLGMDGVIHIDTPPMNEMKVFEAIQTELLNAEQWIITPCDKRSNKKIDRFILKGRDAMPDSFDDWLKSTHVLMH